MDARSDASRWLPERGWQSNYKVTFFNRFHVVSLRYLQPDLDVQNI